MNLAAAQRTPRITHALRAPSGLRTRRVARALHQVVRAAACAWLVLAADGCQFEPPDGKLLCSSDALCPANWTCRSTAHSGMRCFMPTGAREPSAARDAAAPELADAARDAGALLDATQLSAPDAQSTVRAPNKRPDERAPSDASTHAAVPDAHPNDTTEPSNIVPTVLDAAVAPVCQPVRADAERGVFVAAPPLGADSDTCGTSDAPCATIALASTHATTQARGFVYLGAGEYAESLTLAAGLTLIGGWDNAGGAWTRQCTATRAHSAVIASHDNVAVQAQFDGSATLDTLTIRSKSQASPGESVYGVMLRGAATELHLNEVAVEAADAGDGVEGAPGNAGADGRSGCSAGDASRGADATTPAAGAVAGTFGPNGYTPADGQPGSAGMRGGNGSLGEASCVTCRDQIADQRPELRACQNLILNPCLSDVTPERSCGDVSDTAGCAGKPGAGGAPGGGGGSSVAVYVWDGTLVLQGATLQAGNGGLGAIAGVGGKGGSGGKGVAGKAGSTCESTLTLVGVLMGTGPSAAGGGASAGGPGGPGGDGASGGAGAGGFSYALFKGGSARIVGAETATLRHAAGGLSAGSGATGQAGELGP
jgi:hypothetical protein